MTELIISLGWAKCPKCQSNLLAWVSQASELDQVGESVALRFSLFCSTENSGGPCDYTDSAVIPIEDLVVEALPALQARPSSFIAGITQALAEDRPGKVFRFEFEEEEEAPGPSPELLAALQSYIPGQRVAIFIDPMGESSLEGWADLLEKLQEAPGKEFWKVRFQDGEIVHRWVKVGGYNAGKVGE